jgi:2,3-dihydroxybenzoate-AMP ligase
LLLGHPAVLNAACVPMPDPVLGERMCAFVIPRPGQTVTLADLTGYLASKELAKFKWPERLEVVPEFPLSPFGKVSKQELTRRIAELVRREQAGA